MVIKNDQLNDLPAIWPVTCHTDYVGLGTTFVAIKGMRHDGADFIIQALEKGAQTIVIEEQVQLEDAVELCIKDANAQLVRVANARKALATLAAQAYGYPAHKLTIVGITGTKGKTTTAYMVHHILTHAGHHAALVSTVENKIGEKSYKAALTTPQPDYLHMFMDQCVKQGITHLVMETAAQAFTLHRLEGISFDVAIFTNFAHEHLEFYKNLKTYFLAKATIFQQLKPKGIKVINADDQQCAQLIDHYPDQVLFYLNEVEEAHYVPHVRFMYRKQEIEVPHLMGIFNVYNILAALHAAEALHIEPVISAQALITFKGVKGRLQYHKLNNGAGCYIDYAHTPGSYEQVLQLLKGLTNDLIVVFGCGGSKDPFKRPIMGQIAEQYADHIILTSDNPRHEDLQEIIAQIMQGIADQTKVLVQLDRAAAIEAAYAISAVGSIIAILGKGPDEFQCIGDEKIFFSDTQTIQQFC